MAMSPGSAQEALLVVPLKKPCAGEILRILGDPDDLAVPGQVVLAVVKVGLEPFAHLYPVLRSDRHVSPVAQRVGVTPQQESVVHPMLAAIGEGSDMSRFEDRQNPFTGYRTAPAVCVGHDDAKGSLTEARLNQRGRSVAPFVDRVGLLPDLGR